MEATRKNEEGREIYILKSNYLQEFVNEFKKQSFYAKSTNYVGKQLKKAGQKKSDATFLDKKNGGIFFRHTSLVDCLRVVIIGAFKFVFET